MNAIAALDLEPIKVKLMHKESGEGWSLARANAVEFEYRRFLTLMKKFPTEATSPLVDVDTFWHYHILDTMKYAADCQAVFGYFLHHFPYIGMRGEDDAAVLARIGQRMQQLYEAEFGVAYIRATPGATDDNADPAYCGWVPTQQAGQAGAAAHAVPTAYCGWVPTPQAGPAAAAVQTAYCGWVPTQHAKQVAQPTLSALSAYCGWVPTQPAPPAQQAQQLAEGAMRGPLLARLPATLYTERPRLS